MKTRIIFSVALLVLFNQLNAQNTISYGQTLTGSISIPGEVHQYFFTVSNDDQVIIRMTEGGSDNDELLSPSVELYDPSGNIVDSHTDHLQAQLFVTLSVPGTYTILVSDDVTVNGPNTGDYALFLQRTFLPGSASLLTYGQTVEASIDIDGEHDGYTFYGTAGDQVVLRMTEGGGSDNDELLWPIIELFDSTGTPVDTHTHHLQAHLFITLSATGTYTIIVSDDVNVHGSNTGYYTLFVQRTFAPGNDSLITYGQTVEALIDIEGEHDSYTFYGTAGDQVVLRMTEGGGSDNDELLWPIIELFDSTGTPVDTHTHHLQAHLFITLSATGTYTIIVSDDVNVHGSNTGYYTLFVQRTFAPGNDSLITYGQTVSGSIDIEGEFDTYTFLGSQCDSVTIRMTEGSSSIRISPAVELYDPDGTLLISESNSVQAQVGFDLSKNGQYTIIAGEDVTNGSDWGDYSIFIFGFNPGGIASTSVIKNASCYDGGDGEIDINIIGGTPPYTYVWSTGDTSQDVSNLTAGSYYVTVSDAADCARAFLFAVSEPLPLSLESVISCASCIGCSDGAIDLSVSGGTPPYYYDWSNGVATEDNTDLVTGTYSVTVTDSLNCAATGSYIVSEPSPVTISGSVTSELGDSIRSVSVNMSSWDIDSTVITHAGDYSLTGYKCGEYTITPSKDNDITTNNGVSTLDILLIRSHILNILLLNSPYKIIAADVNDTNSVSTQDILLIRSVILQSNPTFPNGKLWTFVPNDYVFPDPQNPFSYPTTRTYNNLTSNVTDADFIGIKLGDVNNDWTPKTGAVGEVNFLMDDYNTLPGSEITVPVRVKDFAGITGYQFTVSWDATVLSLLEVNNQSLNGYYGMGRTTEGYLTTSWYDDMAQEKTLSDNAVAFELKFRATGASGTSSEIKISSELTASEAYNANLDLLSVIPTNGMVKVGNASAIYNLTSNIYNLSVQPNPFSNSTNIVFTLPKDETVSLAIYDILGKEVMTMKESLSAGEHRIEWDGNDDAGSALSNGVYHLRMMAGDEILSGKLMLIRKE